MPASTSPFGKYLRAQRKAARLSQRELAQALGLSNGFICQVERGARPPLAPEHWPALLAALPGASVAELQRARPRRARSRSTSPRRRPSRSRWCSRSRSASAPAISRPRTPARCATSRPARRQV